MDNSRRAVSSPLTPSPHPALDKCHTYIHTCISLSIYLTIGDRVSAVVMTVLQLWWCTYIHNWMYGPFKKGTSIFGAAPQFVFRYTLPTAIDYLHLDRLLEFIDLNSQGNIRLSWSNEKEKEKSPAQSVSLLMISFHNIEKVADKISPINHYEGSFFFPSTQMQVS